VPVLITGESGTGKELAAAAVHAASTRANGPFIPVNCASCREPDPVGAVGHEKGSFTGAHRKASAASKPLPAARSSWMRLETCHRFADQPAALLQDKTIERVGRRNPRWSTCA